MFQSQSAHVSRQFEMSPLEVKEASAEWHQSLCSVSGGRRPIRLGQRVRLAPQPAAASLDPHLLYAVPGRMWLWGRPIGISLEFWMWSDTVSEVSMRPHGLRWPVRTEAYGQNAVATLNEAIWSLHALVAARPVDPALTAASSRTPSSWWAPRVPNPRRAVSAASAVPAA